MFYSFVTERERPTVSVKLKGPLKINRPSNSPDTPPLFIACKPNVRNKRSGREKKLIFSIPVQRYVTFCLILISLSIGLKNGKGLLCIFTLERKEPV